MLFSLLANLTIIYHLFSLPLEAVSFIDASQELNRGEVFLNTRTYQTNEPYRNNNNSLGMKITAASAMVVDERTGLVLWQKNQDKVQPLASISKLMAALVFLDNNPGWDKVMTAQTSDFRGGGKAYIYQGEEITVKDLFNLSLERGTRHRSETTFAIVNFVICGWSSICFAWASCRNVFK